MSKVKSVNSLMAHLRDNHGIAIKGSAQKRKLRNIGYYHGYKGYRYIAKPQNRINFTDFNEVLALNRFDMELKSLFYPLIMFIETALKNYVLEVVLCEGRSEYFTTIYGFLLTDYKRHPAGDKHKKAYKRRLELHDTVYRVLTREYIRDKPVVQHFYHKDTSVPIWAIFEVISLGEFGNFVACLNEHTRKLISVSLNLHQGFDPQGRLTEQIIFAIRDLRNSVAHNEVIFDTRFQRSGIAGSLKNCLSAETAIPNITFSTITDYLILLIYILRNLEVSRTECKKYVKRFEGILDAGWKQIPYPIFSKFIHTDTAQKLNGLKKHCAT